MNIKSTLIYIGDWIRSILNIPYCPLLKSNIIKLKMVPCSKNSNILDRFVNRSILRQIFIICLFNQPQFLKIDRQWMNYYYNLRGSPY